MRLKWRKVVLNLIIGLFVLTGIFYLQITETKFVDPQIFTFKEKVVKPLETNSPVVFNHEDTLDSLKTTENPVGNEKFQNFYKLVQSLDGRLERKTREFFESLISTSVFKESLSETHIQHLEFILKELQKNTNTIQNAQTNMLQNIIENLYIKFTEQTKEKISNSKNQDDKNLPGDKEQTPKTTVNNSFERISKTFKRDMSDRELLEWHYKIMNFTTDIEIKEYYARDDRVIKKFKDPINVKDIGNYVTDLFPQPDRPEDDRILAQLHLKLMNTTPKVIMVRGGSGTQKELDNRGCNVGNCIITKDSTKYPKVDAILFGRSIPKRKRLEMHKDEVWIFSNLESPLNSGSAGMFANWSETYRRDSVVVAPYERFTTFPQYKDLPKTPIRNFAKGKTKFAAWFVSNCNAANGRDAYVKELQKYISVDIFGRCSGRKCSKHDGKCFGMLKTDYKFYLAFENSICKDYISEKVYWNAYQ